MVSNLKALTCMLEIELFCQNIIDIEQYWIIIGYTSLLERKASSCGER